MSLTIITAVIFTLFAASLARDSDAYQNGFSAWSKAGDRRYTIGDHRCPLVLRVVLNATANGGGEGSSIQRTSTLSFGERATLTMHMTRFPFRLLEGLCRISIGAVFLWHTSTASGATHVPFDHNWAAQLHSTLHTIHPDEVSSSLSSFPAGSKLERRNQMPASRTSGTISPGHCEQLNYLHCGRVFLLPLAN